jgi:hypothetical protein
MRYSRLRRSVRHGVRQVLIAKIAQKYDMEVTQDVGYWNMHNVDHQKHKLSAE